MALPNQIEVQSGGDRRLFLGLVVVWLIALVATLINAQRMPALLLVACVALLLWSVPRSSSHSLQPRRLRLQANGSVTFGDWHGRWNANSWRNSWFTVIRIRTDQSQWWAWISARNNLPQDYRRLGIWCRYCPQQAGKAGDNGQLP